MCFKNLPIEFDRHGRPRLVTTHDPFGVHAADRERAIEELVRANHVRLFDIDPVTRVAGHSDSTRPWTCRAGAWWTREPRRRCSADTK